MFPIDRRLIPPTIEQTHRNPEEHADPEVLQRRTLFANALAGDEEAQATLRNTYHLTCCIINGRDILNGKDKNKSRRRHNRYAR